MSIAWRTCSLVSSEKPPDTISSRVARCVTSISQPKTRLRQFHLPHRPARVAMSAAQSRKPGQRPDYTPAAKTGQLRRPNILVGWIEATANRYELPPNASPAAQAHHNRSGSFL